MAEEEKKRRKRGLIIGLAALLIWAIGAVIVVTFVVLRPPDFSGPPNASRDVPNYDDDSPVGLLEQLSLPPRSGRPAAEPFVKPIRIDGTHDDFVLHWQGEEEIDAENLPERMATGLLGDDAIELVAFATWMPEADDKIEVVKKFDPGLEAQSVSVSGCACNGWPGKTAT